MMNIQTHDCEETAREYTATEQAPYRYVTSGLPNVYLIGIRYWICEICKKQAADIPALAPLLTSIARTIVDKHSPLTGAEVRFLRKRLGRRSIDFAEMIGVTPQRLSAIEGGEERPVAEGRDKLVRVIYRALSGDKRLRVTLSKEKAFEKWITSIAAGAAERITATWVANRRWCVEAHPQAA